MAMEGLLPIKNFLISLIFKNWLIKVLKIKAKKDLSPGESSE